MVSSRTFAGMSAILLFGQLASAQTYSLIEKSTAGDCFRTQISMTLSGEIRVIKDAKPALLNLKATADHVFFERTLSLDSHNRIQKAARAYESARATITVDQNRSERVLRAERHLLISQRNQGQALVYSPLGPLTPEEYELTGAHFDSISLAGLLPTGQVKVGQNWKIDNDVAQVLCNFEGLTFQDFQCTLDKVQDNSAAVSIKGTANGIEQGALVKLQIEANYIFDLKKGRLVSLTWKQKDERGQGPASPATKVESTTQLTRSVVEQPAALADVALVAVPEAFEPPTPMTQLQFHHDGKAPFDLTYAREWQIVGQTPEHVFFRLLDRGDFVAQATVTPWDKARPGEHLTPAAFREAMAKTRGWEQGQVVEESEVPPDNGGYIYRFSAPGQMDGLKVMQNFYLIACADGDQVVVAFTMTPAQAEKLGTRDLTLVRGLTLLGNKDAK
jgi:hypothetical protein